MDDIEKHLHFLRQRIRAFAEAKAQRIYLEHFRKSKKAMLINKAEIKGIKTAQERDSYARTQPEYLEVLDGLRVAIENEAKLGLEIETCKLKIEVWRTKESSKRAEMMGYGNRG